MAHLDRSAVIDLLGRLGDTNDETALKAARELHQAVSESGLNWSELLRADLGTPADDDEPAATEEVPAVDSAVIDIDEARRLVERLLARKTMSGTLRDDLTEIKQHIADGSFDEMDARYIRALARRLGV